MHSLKCSDLPDRAGLGRLHRGFGRTIPSVQERRTEHEEPNHYAEGRRVVRVGSHKKPLVLAVGVRSDGDLGLEDEMALIVRGAWGGEGWRERGTHEDMIHQTQLDNVIFVGAPCTQAVRSAA